MDLVDTAGDVPDPGAGNNTLHNFAVCIFAAAVTEPALLSYKLPPVVDQPDPRTDLTLSHSTN